MSTDDKTIEKDLETTISMLMHQVENEWIDIDDDVSKVLEILSDKLADLKRIRGHVDHIRVNC